MFADLNLGEMTPFFAAFLSALAIGGLLGWSAQRSRFCLRQAIVGKTLSSRANAAGTWAIALLVALVGSQWLLTQDVVAFEDHLLYAESLPYLAIIVGGVLFGIGMVLTRGCASRLTVLAASGNLRALYVVILFAIVAHATLKGVLSPARQWVTSVTMDAGGPLPQIAAYVIAALALGVIVWSWRLGQIRGATAIYAAIIGALVPLTWGVTGYVLYDDFDVILLQQISMTLPLTDTLFYTIAASSTQLGFSVGLILGLIAGAFVASALYRETQFQSFEDAGQWRRYTVGAVLMGFGAVIAGGCTLGAALSGLPILSVAGSLTFVSIIAGAKAAALFSETSLLSAKPTTTLSQQPAE